MEMTDMEERMEREVTSLVWKTRAAVQTSQPPVIKFSLSQIHTYASRGRMLPINPSSIFPPSKSAFLTLPNLSPPFATIRCRAADLPVGPSFPRRWFSFPTAVDAPSSGRITYDSDGAAAAPPIEKRNAGNKNANIKVNAREKRWSRDRESYLADDGDALPLPMTHPDSSPVSPDVIDRRLRCDPIVEDCKEVVYEWTGKCRSCQGSGYFSYYNKRGKEAMYPINVFLSFALFAQDASRKMSGSRFLDVQYNLSRRKFLRKPSRTCSSKQNSGMSVVFQPNMDEMRRVFDRFDIDKDGKISQMDYKAILRAVGETSTTRDVQKIFEVADLDRDGFIDFKEYVEVQKKGGGIKTADIQSAFRTFDLDGDGKITAEEVFELLRRLEESCSLQDCRRMVRAVDTKEDGAIDMDEFMTMMTHSMTPLEKG
ncbi:hypothetical protein RJ640_016546 [Escallonia rubra]|uniref:EF-hand domain-containing protein n=1 Tax=Escallonia rubra TaxID=112253 RepID=A0AA88S3R1_9ASTE|nr:hypothetical protein RJ640_016546 [Escallonia rubra]